MSLVRSAQAFTFDCYGTLIDWDVGIAAAIRRIPALRDVDAERFLQRREALEADLQAGPYLPYEEVLARSLRQTAREFGVAVTNAEARAFAASVPDWPPFADAPGFLRRLRRLGKPLAIVSNVTTATLRASVRSLGAPFDLLMTAEDVRSYKPAPAHWLQAHARLGLAPAATLHVAASLHHDVQPALRLGVPCVWVNRRGGPLPPGVEAALVAYDLHDLAERLHLPLAH